MQVWFSAHPDRLLVRVNTGDISEYRLRLSRRYVTLEWPLLLHMDLDMRETRLHSLCKPLSDGVRVTGWDLDPGLSRPTYDSNQVPERAN